MGTESSLVSALREQARQQGVEPTDEDLEGVLGFLSRILPVLAELEERIPRGDPAVTLDPYNAFLHREDVEGDWRVGVKDVIDVAGMPTTAASKVLYRVPERDAACVARLREAGATIVGKLNTHEFAFGALTNSPHFGAALNPWDPERITGGSSGGSGAAVAAGLVDLALGTDTAGSIRIPAALCGVTGHRPTSGLVPVDGVVPVAWSLDAVGPLARTAAECRRATEVMAGRELPQEAPRRIGLITRLFEPADPAVASACEKAARALGDAEPVDLPLHEEMATITQLVMLPEAATVHLHWLRTKLADYGADVRARALAGLLLPSTAYVTGLRARKWVRSLWPTSTTCWSPRRCRSSRRASTRSRTTTGC